MYTHIVVNLYDDSHVHRCILVCYPYMYIDVGVNLWSNLIRVEVWSILWKKEDSRGPKVQKKWYFSIDVVDHTSCHISLTTTESGLRRSRDTTTKAENMIWRWRWRGLETWRSRCWRDTTKSNDHWWTRPYIAEIEWSHRSLSLQMCNLNPEKCKLTYKCYIYTSYAIYMLN